MWIYGLAFVGMGIMLLAFNRQVYNFTGRIDFVESKFPTGTLSFIKLFAVFLVVIGILMVSGIMSFITEPIFQSLQQTVGGGGLKQ